MPRKSKKRTLHGTKTRGINRHKVFITSRINENDNMFFKVADNNNITSAMIKNTVLPRIDNSTKLLLIVNLVMKVQLKKTYGT